MRAGKRDDLIAIERNSGTTDEYGEPIEGWAEIGQEWAAIYYGRGDERRTAATEQGAQAATFEMHSNPLTRGLTLRDRIIADGRAWNIRGVALDTPSRGEVAVTAVADWDALA